MTYGEQPSGGYTAWSDATVLDDYGMTTTTTTSVRCIYET